MVLLSDAMIVGKDVFGPSLVLQQKEEGGAGAPVEGGLRWEALQLLFLS